jgi:hypothetical protein
MPIAAMALPQYIPPIPHATPLKITPIKTVLGIEEYNWDRSSTYKEANGQGSKSSAKREPIPHIFSNCQDFTLVTGMENNPSRIPPNVTSITPIEKDIINCFWLAYQNFISVRLFTSTFE